jgi:hypothetical protein
MTAKLHLLLCGMCVLMPGTVSAEHAAAQTETTSPGTERPVMTAEGAKQFLTAAGLQTCEVSEIDPAVSHFNGAIASLSLGVAEDCATYDAQNPTVVNVHQFTDQQARDAMVASLQNLRYRALRAYANVWAVDDFVLVLLGPQREKAEELIKAEYQRRHPEAG